MAFLLDDELLGIGLLAGSLLLLLDFDELDIETELALTDWVLEKDDELELSSPLPPPQAVSVSASVRCRTSTDERIVSVMARPIAMR